MYPIRRCTLSAFFALIIFSFQASAQDNPLINSGELIQNGSKLHDQQKYSEAIELYKKIDRSDTNYVNALHELSLSYYSDSQFVRSLEYAKLGMKMYREKFVEFSMLAANALDDLNRPEEAIAYYDSALAKNPYNFLVYFNKGIVHYKQKHYDEAKKNFQKCLLQNPYYSSAHYFLGNIYVIEGNPVAGLLAFQTYLLIAPEGRYFSNVVKNISDVITVNDEVLGYVKNRKITREDNFKLQQDILLSKIALDKQYKLKASLEDDIVRQLQVVAEKLEYNRNDAGFAMQFYVPYYATVIKDEHFEPMVFTMFAGIKNKKIEEWNKKNKKDKQEFIDKASAYFDNIKLTQTLDKTQRENASISYLNSNNVMVGKGKMSGDKEPQAIGKWEYFHSNGMLKAAGSFNDKGEKDGSWTFYYDNGERKERYNYHNGVPDGLAEGWFKNGNRSYTQIFKEGKLEGLQTVYYFNDVPNKVTMFKDDKHNGEQRYYDFRGNLTYSATYVNDVLEGTARNYYPGNIIQDEMFYKNDKLEGTYKQYFASGKLKKQGETVKGLSQGLWTTYYENGNIAEKTTYQDNEITGEFTECFENGKLSRRGFYYKKKLDGKLENFDDDGILYSEAVYDRGKLKEIKFMDKKGNILSSTTTRKGAASITFYTPEGHKQSEGFFNKEGNRDGKFVSYYPSGKISEESNWKNGMIEGEFKSFYSNGKLKRTSFYVNDEEEGNVKDYYANGKISGQGWKTAGKRQQNFLYYDALGNLSSQEYYYNGDLDGYSRQYMSRNRLNTESKYENGWLESIEQFDSSGNSLVLNVFPKGKGSLIYKYPGGKKSAEASYDHYLLNGPFTYYFFDGSLSAKSFFKNDLRDSLYISYYYGGKKAIEGQYKLGEKDGLWKYYHPDGRLKEEEIYKNGNLEGIDKIYSEDGSVDKTITFKNGQFHGPYEVFSDKGQLAVRLNYANGSIKSYQYEVKPGTLSEPILLPGGSGKIIAKFPNGKTSYIATYVDGDQEGERKLFYTNGNPFTEGLRINGVVDGTFKVYYPDGHTWKEETYVMGELHGKSKNYYPSGKLKSEEQFHFNSNDGLNKYYDESGKLKSTYVYDDGNLLMVK